MLKGLQSTPLLLFLMLLLILVFAAYWGNSSALRSWVNPEGFIGFNSDSPPVSRVVVPLYDSSKQLIKLYDNMYFDNVNANVVEVMGNQADSGNVQASNLVTAIRVYTRAGDVGGPYLNNPGIQINEASIASITNMMKYNEIQSDVPNTHPYILYFAIGTETFLHVIDTGSNATSGQTNVLSAHIYSDKITRQEIQYFDGTYTGTALGANFKMNLNEVGTTQFESDQLSDISFSYYGSGRNLKKIGKQIAVDPSNGSFVIIDGSNLNVYTRAFTRSNDKPVPDIYNSASPATNISNTVATVPYKAWYVVTPDNNVMLYVINWGTFSYIAQISKRNRFLSADPKSVRVLNFADTSSDSGSSSNSGSASSDTSSSAPAPSSTTDSISKIQNQLDALTHAIESKGNVRADSSSTYSTDINNWLGFWNTVANSKDLQTAITSSNYIPKTSVIPPVCPTCPSCANGGSGGVCNSCGGNGGSGAIGNGRNRFSDFVSNFGSGTKDLLEKTGSGTKDLLEDTGSGVKGFAQDTAKGTVGLARETAQGTVGLAKEAVGGTVGLAKETVGGTIGLAKETVGGTLGLVKDAGSGLMGAFGRLAPTQIAGSSYGGGAGYSNGIGGGSLGGGAPLYQTQGGVPGVDPYSYYGALPSRNPGNYMPITADFSAFGK